MKPILNVRRSIGAVGWVGQLSCVVVFFTLIGINRAEAQESLLIQGPWFFKRPLEAVAESPGAVQEAVLLKTGIASADGKSPSMISSSGSLAAANLYRFSSKEIHPNCGMYYYLYRFYDPSTQRWLNRDPLGESAGANLFSFVGNSALERIDALGLKLWYCTTPTTMFGGIGRHGYVWNDDPSANGDYKKQYCGQEGSSGTGSQGTQNTGPVRGSGSGDYGDGGWGGTQSDGRDVECTPIDGTDNDATNAGVMQDCNDSIDNNPWIGPGIWDCHTSARKFLSKHGYNPPPFRRWNNQFPKVWPSIPSSPRPPVTLPPNYRVR